MGIWRVSPTYNAFADALQQSVSHVFWKRAHLGQLRESKLLALSGLLQLSGILLENSDFRLHNSRGVKLSHSYFAYCAVTDEVPKPENVRYHRLVVSLSEHKSDELAYRGEENQHVFQSLLFVLCPWVILCKRLGYPSCDLVLIDEILFVELAVRKVNGHGLQFYFISPVRT